jgi:alkylated DNA repair dioxygenase AlkB
VLQPELFQSQLSFDPAFSGIRRVQLDDRSWVDFGPWISGSAALFDELRQTRPWQQRTRKLFDKEMLEPRLTAGWSKASGQALEPKLLEDLRQSLSNRYGVELDSIGFNYYRDGQDSVAWHRDHIAREVKEPVVALVSLGEPRKLLLRPYGGGASTPFLMHSGDLLVTGGLTQRRWEHAILKVAHAGPRISLAFRHGLRRRY